MAGAQAVANVPAGAAELAKALEMSHSTGRPVSVIAFSLGCRVVLYALEAGVIPPASIERMVFVGSAAPATAFEVIPPLVASGTGITHVFSRRDAVLDRLYPLGRDTARPSGREPLEIPGVENVEVDVGHRSYASIAGMLWSLALAPGNGITVSP